MVTLTSVVIGRDPSCDLVVPDEYASPRHAILTRRADGTAWVEDQGTTNVTRVNGMAAYGPTRVIAGDVLTIGRTRITVPPFG